MLPSLKTNLIRRNSSCLEKRHFYKQWSVIKSIVIWLLVVSGKGVKGCSELMILNTGNEDDRDELVLNRIVEATIKFALPKAPPEEVLKGEGQSANGIPRRISSNGFAAHFKSLNRQDIDHIFPPIAAAPLNPKVNAQWSLEQSERKRLQRAMVENGGQVKGEEVSYRKGDADLESLFGEPDGSFDLETSGVLQGEEDEEAE